MKKLISLFSIIPIAFAIIVAKNYPESFIKQTYETVSSQNIFKKVLDNGFTIIVKPTTNIENVAIKLWYKVGSKDEQTDEKGLAHLLEHTVFKGTNELSESDYMAVIHKLSGTCNAHTIYDHTCYEFELPERHWKEALPILSDCMVNCTFKEDLLNSEFKAVIQELKMYRDKYFRVLCQEMVSTIFADHPYHYPVIGFKQDIWNITPEKLHNFYKKHYLPNNAILTVVGNVNPQDVFAESENYFGKIKSNPSYKKKEFYFNQDIASKNVTVYRDVQSPQILLAFNIPGIKQNTNNIINIISSVLFNDKSSRLNQKLVHELQLVNDIYSFNYGLYDHDIFFIGFEPRDIKKVKRITSIIQKEIENFANNGMLPLELKKITNSSKLEYCNLLKSNSSLANTIGIGFLATGDENTFLNSFNEDFSKLEEQVKLFTKTYFRPSVMHTGYLLPLTNDQEKENWKKLQENSDKEDMKVLNERIRTSEIEPCKYAEKIVAKPVISYNFPKPNTFTMNNGIKVLYHNDNSAPYVSLSLSLVADNDYDSDSLPGLNNFTRYVLSKGTKNYSAKQIAEELESRGTTLSISSHEITMTALRSEFEESLHILNEILTEPTFDENEIEKVRQTFLDNIKSYWDNQTNIAGKMIYENIYKDHQFGRNYKNKDVFNKITRDDIIAFYNKFISPKGATLAIVGDLTNLDLKTLLENKLGNWDGPEIEKIKYPKIKKVKPQEFNYYMNRDQVFLCFAGLSVDIKHPDFEKLILFDEMLKGLKSKLFELRERTGLFYTISGSLTNTASMEPGIVYIDTLTSLEQLKEAEELISSSFDKIIDSITEQDVKEALGVYINSLTSHYSNNSSVASTFLFLDSYEYEYDYFDKIINRLKEITAEDIKTAARKILNNKSLIKVRVGRVKN